MGCRARKPPNGVVGGSNIVVVLNGGGSSAFRHNSTGAYFDNRKVHGKGLIRAGITDEDGSPLRPHLDRPKFPGYELDSTKS